MRTKRPAATTSASDSADLHDDEQVAEAEPPIAGDRPALILQRFGRRKRRRAERGHGAEDERRHEPDARGEREHAQIDRRVEVVGRELRDEERRPEAGDRQPERRAGAGDEQALADELPRDARARGAEREAHRQIAPPRVGARQHQVRDVRARDEQHRADHHHHRDERLLEARPERRIAPSPPAPASTAP